MTQPARMPCNKCGGRMVDEAALVGRKRQDDESGTLMICPDCGYEEYIINNQ